MVLLAHEGEKKRDNRAQRTCCCVVSSSWAAAATAMAAAAAAQFGFSWSKCVSVFGVTIVLSGEERRVGKKGQYIDWSQRAQSVGREGAAQPPYRGMD